MVFYFTCSDPRYTIYMGRDKYENEELIRYGWPEDLWFHVDKHSSAHVYLRLPKGDDWESVPQEIVHECAQLTKANSIEGCKLSHVSIVYTPWSNLRKNATMADGQVGFGDRSLVRYTLVEHRVNAIVNRLNKTKTCAHNEPRELAALRAARDAEAAAEADAARREKHKQTALEREAARIREASKVETIYGMEAQDVDTVFAAQAQADAELAAALAVREKQQAAEKGAAAAAAARRSVEEELVDDMFGTSCSFKVGGKLGKKLGKKKAAAKASASGGSAGCGGGGGAGGGGGGGSSAPSAATTSAGQSAAAAAVSVVVDDGDGDWSVGGAGGGDDDDEWGSPGGTMGAGGSSLYDESAGVAAGGTRHDPSLGAMGIEAAELKAKSKSADEMVGLVAIAHQRREEAAEKARAKAAAKAAEKEAAARAAEAAAEARAERMVKVTDEVAALDAAARAAVVRAEKGGQLAAALEANERARGEEMMVLEAIFGDDLSCSDDGDGRALSLKVSCERRAPVLLRLRLPAEYPSHLPPEILEISVAPSNRHEAAMRGGAAPTRAAAFAVRLVAPSVLPRARRGGRRVRRSR